MPNWFTSFREYCTKSWQRLVTALVCLTLVIARLIWPSLNIDWITIALIAIAAFALLFPTLTSRLSELKSLLPYIKKVDALGFGVELTEKVKELASETTKATEAVERQQDLNLRKDFAVDRDAILQELHGDPRAALLLLGAKIEQKVLNRLRAKSIIQDDRYIPVRRAIEMGVKERVFPQEVLGPFNDFWAIRNQVAHNQAFQVDDSAVLSLVDLGIDLLRLLSVEGTDGPGDSK